MSIYCIQKYSVENPLYVTIIKLNAKNCEQMFLKLRGSLYKAESEVAIQVSDS